MSWLGKEISHGNPEIYKHNITIKNIWSVEGGRQSYVTEVENRFVSFTYLIVDSKICILSMRSREECPCKYTSG